ncbi:MAG: SDR family NAD(P)-dependent oxidoreductase [bacterium]
MTRGAVAAGGEAAVSRPDHAALWGLASAAAAERPELGPALVDLDPLGPSESAAAVVGELLGADREPAVALRREGRSVPRLTVDPGPPPSPPGLPERGPWHLDVGERGSLEGLRFVTETAPAPALTGHLVEVEVEASGLNFRDVLNALGLYPGDPGPLGGELAGVVTRIGPAVTRVAVGERVFGLARRAIADRAIADDRLLAPRPAGVSAEHAAGLPMTWLTAAAAFARAGLAAGQRVLIHSAAGGVGLAAVALAQAIGAEIHATASPAKWPLLRAQGVERVYHSRTTDFADAILDATGGAGVDVVLSALTLDGLEASLRATRPGGVVVDIAKNETAALCARWPDRRYVAYDLVPHALDAPEDVAALLDGLAARFASGALSPAPTRVVPVERAVEALRVMARGRHVGKLVVSQVARRRRLAGWPERVPPGAVLVTGGLGALGLATARWLAERGAERIVLLGRRAAVGAEAAAQIAAMEAAGAAVRVEAGDIAAPGVAERVVAAITAAGPLAGVIHAAGVLDDALLEDLSPAQVAAALRPKLIGATALHRATAGVEHGFFTLFGSATALVGAPGQAAYAAANAALAALAEHRRGLGLPATVVDWGPWAEIGMAARLDPAQQARLVAGGIRLIAPGDAFAALERIWRADRERAVVLPFDRARLAGPLPPLFAELIDDGGAAGGPLLDRLRRAAPAERVALLVEHVGALVCRGLGVDPAVGIDPRRPLTEVGVDSLMALELRNALGAALDRRLSATVLYDHPTIEALATWLAEGFGPPAAPVVVAAAPVVTPAAPVVAAEPDLAALDAAALAALLRAELDEEEP